MKAIRHRKRGDGNEEARHPIGVVSNRTGIPQDLLRAWERRYEVAVPERTKTGRRLYSDGDIERLRLIKLAMRGGRRISDVAALSNQDLLAMIREDGLGQPAGIEMGEAISGKIASSEGEGSRPVTKPQIESLLRKTIGAMERLDHAALEKALKRARISLSPAVFRRDIVQPLMNSIGDRWREGSLRMVHEHLASAVVRSFLAASPGTIGQSRHGPRIVLTTPAGQQHELGALMASSAAEEVGWHPVYLGPSLPAQEIAFAAETMGARVVALSVVFHADDPMLREELKKIRSYLPEEITLLVGGRACSEMQEFLGSIGIEYTDDFVAFQNRLDSIRLRVDAARLD